MSDNTTHALFTPSSSLSYLANLLSLNPQKRHL